MKKKGIIIYDDLSIQDQEKDGKNIKKGMVLDKKITDNKSKTVKEKDNEESR